MHLHSMLGIFLQHTLLNDHLAYFSKWRSLQHYSNKW